MDDGRTVKSDLVDLEQPNSEIQHVSVKKKKNLPLFDNLDAAITFSVFGVRENFWYLGTPTLRDLFISEVFLDIL